jgi:hypothetical protein
MTSRERISPTKDHPAAAGRDFAMAMCFENEPPGVFAEPVHGVQTFFGCHNWLGL